MRERIYERAESTRATGCNFPGALAGRMSFSSFSLSRKQNSLFMLLHPPLSDARPPFLEPSVGVHGGHSKSDVAVMLSPPPSFPIPTDVRRADGRTLWSVGRPSLPPFLLPLSDNRNVGRSPPLPPPIYPRSLKQRPKQLFFLPFPPLPTPPPLPFPPPPFAFTSLSNSAAAAAAFGPPPETKGEEEELDRPPAVEEVGDRGGFGVGAGVASPPPPPPFLPFDRPTDGRSLLPTFPPSLPIWGREGKKSRESSAPE